MVDLKEDTAWLHLILFVEADGGDVVQHESAQVVVDGRKGRTNENGSVIVGGVSPGEHEVSIEFAGDGAQPLTLEPMAFAAGETTEALITVDGRGALVTEDITEPVEATKEATKKEERPEQQEKKAKKPGSLAGVIKDGETGEPIQGAQIYVRGIPEPLTTDEKGRFETEVLQGEHAISVLHSKYASLTEEEIVVEPGAITELDLKLTPSSAELEDYVITAPYVEGGVSSAVAEEQKATNVQDVIGAEQMSKSGDSDASSALKRVTGLTVVGGKFIYVRGMGERYSQTLLNGALVPSPEPERRVVPLDLFPTSVLESVVVQKTYSPDVPAEFGGGTVQLRTRDYPDELLFKVGGSLSGDTQTTFRQGPTYQGGSLDWLGTDDGSRARSEALARVSERGDPITLANRFEPGLSDEEVAELGRSLPNNWNTSERFVPPGGKLNVTAGNMFEIGEVPVGFIATTQYSNSWSRRKEIRRSVRASSGEVEVATDFDVERLQNNVGVTGMLGAGAELSEGHEVMSTTLLLRNTDNLTLLGSGEGLEGDQRFTRLRFVERQLLSQQLRGEHTFEQANDFQASWRFVYSKASRNEPDRRDYRYDFAPDQQAYLLSVRGGAVQRFYSKNDDEILEGGLDLAYPIKWKDPDLATVFKIGGMIVDRSRVVTTYRYQYRIDNYQPVDERNDLRREDMETIMQPGNIRPDGVNFVETTGEDEPYDASQEILAGYGMVESPILPSLSFMAGLRYENSRQLVASTNEEADLETGDFLPTGTLTWTFAEDMQIRAGVSRTVSRPDFRELSLARFFNVEASTEIIGNPDLRRATILNYDLRWEWYLAGAQSVSVAAFAKQFDDPIETVVLAGTSRRQSWQNADAALNTGAEFEFRKRLSFVSDFWDSFYLAGNLTLIDSEVTLDPNATLVNTSTERALEGQSPYVLNLQFGFDDDIGDEASLSATVLFNVAGRRIVGVGANNAPDIYEEPVPRLDLVLRHEIDSHWTWGFKAQNLFDAEVVQTQGDIIVGRFLRGVSFSLGASYAY